MFISLVIPVYNRPQEVRELLESLTHQTRRDFETVVVEDGSAPELSSDGVVREYADRLDICYVRQPNGGPAAARPGLRARSRTPSGCCPAFLKA